MQDGRQFRVLRAEHLRQFAARLLTQPGQFGGIRWLAFLLHRVEIPLAPLGSAAFDVAHRLLDLRGQRTQNRSVERQTVRMGRIRIVTGLPLRTEQRCQQRTALVFQSLEFCRRRLRDIRVRLGTPPLVLGAHHFRGPAAAEQLIHVRHDDVANGRFGTTNGAKVGDISGVIRRLDFVPGEIEPPNHDDFPAPAVVIAAAFRRRD